MPKKIPSKNKQSPGEIEALRARLAETEEALRAIRDGDLDALVVSNLIGDKLLAVEGANQPYRVLIESISEGALTLTPEGLVLYANRRFAEMLRTPLEKVIGSEIHTWFAPESRQVVQALLRNDVIGNRSEELALTASDGTQVPVYLSVNHLLLEGVPDSFCMVATDLTEQKRNEAMLAAERLARAILEQAADAIVVCDETGRIIRASKQAQAFHDRNLIGQSFEHAFPLRLLDGTSFAPVGPIDSSQRHSVEARLERNGHRFDFLVSVGRLKGAGKELLGSVVTLTDITESKRAAEALVVERTLLRTLIDAMPDVIFAKDAVGRFTMCNAAALRHVGKASEEDIVGKSVFDFYPRELAETFHADDLAALSGKPVLDREEIGMDAAGNQRWYLTTKVPLHDRTGTIGGMVGISRDITERKRIELASIRLAAIVESSEDAIIGKDLSSIITSWNKGAENIFGYTADEMVGTSVLRLIPSDRREEEDDILEKIKRGKSVEHFDTLRQTKDGRLIDVSVTTSPIKDAAGRVIGVSKLARDITERKHAERKLQESEAKFRHLIEQADDGIFISDAQGNFILVNSRGCELLGYTEEQLLGMNGKLTYADGETEFHAERMQAVGAGNALRFERMVKRKDGSTFPAEISVKMLDNGMVQVIFHDITVRRSQEKKISRLSRIHAVLSGINAAIVRIRDRTELFQEACRIIVEHGHFILGWIAVLDHATGKLTAVAQAGLPASAGADSHLFDGSVALVPGGTAQIALEEKRSAIDNAIDLAPGLVHENVPDTLKVRRAAIALGAKSVIVLPLFVEGETFGILTLYAPERDFFDDEEIKLLNELAGDISFGLEFIAKEEKAEYLAYYDALTGLANRRLFLERVTQYMRSAISGGHKLALYLIDLERFKNINDSLGRAAGDALLKQVGQWLTRNAEDANLVARVGADHFAVVMPKVRQEGDVARVLEKSMAAFLEHPFRLNDAVFRIGHKVGIALFPDDGADADSLFKNAEAALKKAKASGDRYLFYAQKMTEMVAGKLTLENQLRHALDNEEFVLHYQPKVSLSSGKLTGAEALIRWNDPRTGLVPPVRFIPILEETGLIHEVGRWALHKAIEDYLRWRRAGLAAVPVAVNVSPLQLRNRDFIAEIKQAIGSDPQTAAGLELEITESLIMEDVNHSIASLQAIRAMGVCISIDDFGTGFSSLSYLSKLPVDTLKIDRSFVTGMTAGPEGLALVSTIIDLAHSLKLKVVAEGVETEEQSRLLRLLDCDEMQGFLFSKPVPSETFEGRFLAAFPTEVMS